VLELGNSLIDNNDGQIDKEVTAASGDSEDSSEVPKLHRLEEGMRGYEDQVSDYAADLIDRWLDEGVAPGSIMVLCRYDKGSPYVSDLKRELRRLNIPYDGKDDRYRPPDMPDKHERGFDSEAGVSVFSVHQAKGREADRVLLLHAAEGKRGFPPEENSSRLVEPVQEVPTNTTEEERRLFYVAVTRAMEELHIQTRADEESPFVDEIDEHLLEVDTVLTRSEEDERIEVTAMVNHLFGDVHDKQHQAGYLKDKTGSTKFVSWENSDPPTLSEDVWYRIRGAKVNEWKEEKQLVIDDKTEVIDIYSDRSEESDGQTSEGEIDSIGRPPVIEGGPDIDIEYNEIERDRGISMGSKAYDMYSCRAVVCDSEYPVMVKEVNQDGGLDSEAVRAILSETNALTELTESDYFADIVDHDTDPVPWIAIEYLNGGSLGDRIGAMSFEEWKWTASVILRAFRDAHLKDRQHLRLTPDSILYRSTAEGYWDVPKVADWGPPEENVTGVDLDHSSTTSKYAAPEQLYDRYGSIDARTDVYQIATILYECLTGTHPYYHSNQTDLSESSLLPPSRVDTSLPSEVDEVLMCGVKLNPEDRYDDILSFYQELTNTL
jgi:hypothetical protein